MEALALIGLLMLALYAMSDRPAPSAPSVVVMANPPQVESGRAAGTMLLLLVVLTLMGWMLVVMQR